MPFQPRLLFPLPGRTPSWFVGHMARSLRDLPALLKDIDLVIEARDARLPITSINPVFDEALGKAWPGYGEYSGGKGKGKEKLVVYTKRDLAEARFESVSAAKGRADRSLCNELFSSTVNKRCSLQTPGWILTCERCFGTL